jgi:hypothetical protein
MQGIRLGAGVFGVAVAFLASVSAAGAQVIRIPGNVKDDTGHPVRGAVIVAENPDQAPPRYSATSNDKGQFGFIGLRRGLWTFTIEAPGYESVRVQRQVTNGNRQEPLDVRLARIAAAAARPLDAARGADVQQAIDRAEAFAQAGDIDAAIAAWRDLLSKVPALTTIHLRIGALYEQKSDVEKALASYRQLLEIEPANEKARAAVDRLSKS